MSYIRLRLDRILTDALYGNADLVLVLTQKFLKFIHCVRHISFSSAHKESL